MKINLAVYTATEGFDWQPGSAYSRADLNKYKEMIGRFPDILMEKVPYGGIFVCEGKLVFYRLHIALRWDSRGRDALYCVLGTLPLDAGKKINLSRVFEMPEFRAPMRPFPLAVEIEESLPARPPSTWEEMQDALNSPSSSAQVGVLATFFGHGKFFCRLDGSVENPTPRITYENCDLKPAPKVEPKPPVEVTLTEVTARSDEAAIERRAYERARLDFEKRLTPMELDKKRMESENQSLKNLVMILAGVIVVLVIAGVGTLLFSHCFRSSPNPVQVENQKMPSWVGCVGQGQKPSEVVDGSKQTQKSVGVKQTQSVAGDQKQSIEKQITSTANPQAASVSNNLSSATGKGEALNQASQNNISQGSKTSPAEVANSTAKSGVNKQETANNIEATQAASKQDASANAVACSNCNGCGKIERFEECSICKGSGSILKCKKCNSREYVEYKGLYGCWYCKRCEISVYKSRCDKCHGDGLSKTEIKCDKCGGTGKIAR